MVAVFPTLVSKGVINSFVSELSFTSVIVSSFDVIVRVIVCFKDLLGDFLVVFTDAPGVCEDFCSYFE